MFQLSVVTDIAFAAGKPSPQAGQSPAGDADFSAILLEAGSEAVAALPDADGPDEVDALADDAAWDDVDAFSEDDAELVTLDAAWSDVDTFDDDAEACESFDPDAAWADDVDGYDEPSVESDGPMPVGMDLVSLIAAVKALEETAVASPAAQAPVQRAPAEAAPAEPASAGQAPTFAERPATPVATGTPRSEAKPRDDAGTMASEAKRRQPETVAADSVVDVEAAPVTPPTARDTAPPAIASGDTTSILRARDAAASSRSATDARTTAQTAGDRRTPRSGPGDASTAVDDAPAASVLATAATTGRAASAGSGGSAATMSRSEALDPRTDPDEPAATDAGTPDADPTVTGAVAAVLTSPAPLAPVVPQDRDVGRAPVNASAPTAPTDPATPTEPATPAPPASPFSPDAGPATPADFGDVDGDAANAAAPGSAGTPGETMPEAADTADAARTPSPTARPAGDGLTAAPVLSIPPNAVPAASAPSRVAVSADGRVPADVATRTATEVEAELADAVGTFEAQVGRPPAATASGPDQVPAEAEPSAAAPRASSATLVDVQTAATLADDDASAVDAAMLAGAETADPLPTSGGRTGKRDARVSDEARGDPSAAGTVASADGDAASSARVIVGASSSNSAGNDPRPSQPAVAPDLAAASPVEPSTSTSSAAASSDDGAVTAFAGLVAAATASQASTVAATHAGRASRAVGLDAVGLEIARRTRGGESHFAIRLDPEGLGSIDVDVDFSADGGVRAHLQVERPETLDSLSRDKRGIEQVLRDAGFSLGDEGVSLSLRQDGSDGRSAGDPRQQAEARAASNQREAEIGEALADVGGDQGAVARRPISLVDVEV